MVNLRKRGKKSDHKIFEQILIRMSSCVKAFLCSQDGTYNFPLSPKLTTIGKENCDINLNCNAVDSQHAIIEYLDDENYFVIHDLNTVNGTFVNDLRVQNGSVRINEQDIIRFGYNGTPFQLVVHSHIVTIPPINLCGVHRQSVNQPLQLINQTLPCRQSTGFLNTTNQQTSNSWLSNAPPLNCQGHHSTSQQGTVKNSASSLRSRPVSAGVNRRTYKEIIKINSWTKGGSPGNVSSNSPTQIDSETYRQDEQQDLNSRLVLLDRELKVKVSEIRELRDKIAFYQNQQNSGQNTEFEQIKRDKSIAVGLVNTMQKDLSNKDTTISKLAREIEGYKRELKEKDSFCKELEEKLRLFEESKKVDEDQQNKEKELIVLKTKLIANENKIIDLNNQILHQKNEIEELKKQSHVYLQTEKQIKEELEHSKNQFLDMQRTERTVRIDLEQIKRTYEKFRNLVIQSIYSTPGKSGPSGDMNDDDIITEWKKIIDERSKFVKTIQDLNNNLKMNEEINLETIQSINNFESQIIGVEERLLSHGRKSNFLIEEIKKLKEKSIHDNLGRLKQCLTSLYENELNWESEIESKLKEFGIDIENNLSVSELLNVLQIKFKTLNEINTELEIKLEEAKTNNENSVNELLEAKENEFKSKYELIQAELNEKHLKQIEIIESELNEKHLKELEGIKAEHESFNNLVKNDLATKIAEFNEESTKLNNIISSLNEEIAATKAELELVRAQDQTNLLKEKLTELENERKLFEERFVCEIIELKNQMNTESNNYQVDLELHKEQIKQHSLTIVNFEKELSQLKLRDLEHLAKIDQLEKRLKESSSNHVHVVAHSPPSPPTKNNQEVQTTSLQKTIDILRGECSTYKSRLIEQEELIKTLRRDLTGASAKLSDVHGEMTEKQKRELERNKQLVIDQQRELSDTRAQMAKLSEIIDKQTKQLETNKNEMSKSKSLIEKYRVTSEENGKLAIELKSKLEMVELQLKKYEGVKKEEGKITSELTALGAQCKGERHEQVIVRQREALNELRQRVKLLEQTRPSVPTHQQQMQQQIMLLKKQLAEVRASQALSEDIAKHANLSRVNDDAFAIIEEKTAHFETQSALDASEESFLTLLRTVSSLLNINELDGLRSMANLPADERHKLNLERCRSIEAICLKIRNLIEKLQRKEELLKDYEIDLAKLRQAEFLLDKKSEQLQENQVNTRNRDDEIDYLKESLRNAKLELEKEKLLNSAIKEKRNISSIQTVTERVRRGSTDTLHHHCPPEDQRVHLVKKNLNDKLKRKDYELKTLKKELKDKTEVLTNLSSRLTVVENGRVN